MKRRADKDRVVITGLGPMCSLGNGPKEVWDSVINKRLNLVENEYALDGQEWGRFRLHKMKSFDINDFGLPKDNFEYVDSQRGFRGGDPDLHYLLAVLKLAIDDSGLSYDPQANDVGLVLTQESPGVEPFFETVIDSSFEFLKDGLRSLPTKLELAKKLYDKCDEPGYSLQTFSYLYAAAKVFDIHGSSLFINNACASGLFAIETAANQLRSGANSAVIVAAAERPVNIYKYLWFKKNGLYAEDGITRPFSKEKSGIVFGDGGCALVMEPLSAAKKRGARIYAEYCGGGFSLEGWKITVPNIAADFYKRSFEKALLNACVAADDVDFVNPHGVGMKVTDTYEARTINRVFGKKRPSVSAFKPMVGHNLGGSALLETAIAVMSIVADTIPATLNCDIPDEKLGLDIVRKDTKKKIDIAAKMSCGFAGFSGVAIFKKYKVTEGS